ncbi:Clp protease N-terminal domain-containing protein [Geodermatophilus sp. SYSU D00703]
MPESLPSPDDPAAALAAVVALRRLATRLEADAVTEAISQGWTWAQVPEHLLLAATALPDGTATRALARAGGTPEALREAVAAGHAAAIAGVGIGAQHQGAEALRAPVTGPLRSTPQAQQVFQQAVALAKAGRSPLRGAHVVAAACALERGTAVRALTALGVDREALRAAARAELGLS